MKHIVGLFDSYRRISVLITLLDLIDSILQLYSVEMSMSLVKLANRQLLAYFERFRTRLKTVHMIHLKRLILFLKALENEMTSQFKDSPQTKEKVMSVTAFVEAMGSKVNGINFLEINDYLSKSRVITGVEIWLKCNRTHEVHLL